MAYVKNTWVDQEGQIRYRETQDGDLKIFTPNYEQVTEIGTPVNADNMNHIEQGIYDCDTNIEVLDVSKLDVSTFETEMLLKADITSTFGYGQTLQNVTSQRTLGATYTNTTGKPIIVIVYDSRQDNVWHSFSIYVDGMQVGYSDGYGHNASGGMCTFIVPNGSTYRVNGGPIANWVEYR